MAGESRSRRITTVRVRGDRLYSGRGGRRPAVEEPLDLRVRGVHLATLLRTPGHDVELAHGHLFAAGTITGREDVGEARYCDGAVTVGETGLPQNTYNVLDVAVRDLAPGFLVPPTARHRTGPEPVAVVTSPRVSAPAEDPERAVTGERSIADVLAHRTGPLALTAPLDPLVLFAGGRELDASGTEDAATSRGLLLDLRGEVLVMREDVHRENLLDKLVGWALLADRLPLGSAALVLTGPVDLATVRRAFLAGIPVVASAGPATSLAIDAAQAFGLTLVTALAAGADGEAHAEVLTHPERLDLTQAL